ncbi:hypothetical protein [Nocardia alni]|uniref:hypothetical protein n=1 Tax=Nocardia alni TaxID=2815723 RepID=UPI001C210BFC|nr:hypothetical protein [Nocardia alni]
MARVVFVHGIGAQVSGEAPMSGRWLAAMNAGLTRAGTVRLSKEQVAFAFYGDLFRPSGEWPPVNPSDREHDLLMQWWRSAAQVDLDVVPPTAEMSSCTPMSARMALHQLARSRFFAGVGARTLCEDLRQVGRYFTEPELRQRIRHTLRARLAPDTRVVVAHSLGSVVAYETLCATPEHRVRVLVTLGSPLGVVFDLLDPALKEGIGRWPGPPELVWTNIADRGDVVASAGDLRVRFGPHVRNALVCNGVHAHSAMPYLADGLTGQAVAQGLIGHG